MPTRKLISIAVVTSLALHIAAVGLLASWRAAWQSQVSFGGEQLVLHFELLSEPTWQPPATTMTLAEPTESVVIEPLRATIGRQHFRHTPSQEVRLTELVPPELDSSLELAATRAADDSATAPQLVKDTPPDGQLARQPTPSAPPTAASVPQLAGTDAQTPPRFTRSAPPRYPEEARRRGWQGTVLLRVSIDDTGRVTEVDVARSSGYAVLDGAAVVAVRQWKGEPARRGGVAVATVELLPVRFKLATR